MKSFEITNSNSKGLFCVNEKKECNISDIVKDCLPVKFTANGKEVVIIDYNNRNFHRKDSAFEYFLKGSTKKARTKGVHGLQCADLRELLGFEKESKQGNKVRTFHVANLELATKEELENLKKEVEKFLNAIYAKELKEKKRQEVLKTLTPEQREALGL